MNSMKYYIMTALFAGIMIGCARKLAPAAAPSTVVKTEESIKTGAAGSNESSMSVAGHATFDAKCGNCHELKKPADYTATQWVPIVHRMAPHAKLDSTERANVLAYVNTYSNPG
jgi:cytochrome c5